MPEPLSGDISHRPPLSIRLLAFILRHFFALLYHQFAWTYDAVAAAVSLGRWKDWLLSVLPYLHGTSILELGHGPGHLQLAMQRAGLECIGLDRSPYMSRIARRRLRMAGLPLRLVNADAQALPFASASFPCIVATFPSEYIFSPRTLSEIHRLLSPGGTAVILAVAYITGRTPWDRAAAWLFRFTGQAPRLDPSLFEPLNQSRFLLQFKEVDLPTSRVVLILAQKPA